MSARKIDVSSLLGSTARPCQCLTLSAGEVQIRKSGIEFRSNHSIAPWTEMTVSLQIPHEMRKMHCTGVVVACSGNRESGYKISMLFTNLSRQAQARLSSLAR
jgi:hypothetical protein